MLENKINQAAFEDNDGPYDRFVRFGSESLTDAELLAICLRTGTKDMNAVALAKRVLELTRYPKKGLLGLCELTLEELMTVKGIGLVKAVKLKSLAEISMRIHMEKAHRGLVFHEPRTVANYYMEKLRHKPTECVYLLCLNAKGLLISEKELTTGSVNMSLISPREIFVEALQRQAVEIILLHNHPSGDPTPSRADIMITKDLKELSEKLNVTLVDHIIIGDNQYMSFQEHRFFS